MEYIQTKYYRLRVLYQYNYLKTGIFLELILFNVNRKRNKYLPRGKEPVSNRVSLSPIANDTEIWLMLLMLGSKVSITRTAGARLKTSKP